MIKKKIKINNLIKTLLGILLPERCKRTRSATTCGQSVTVAGFRDGYTSIAVTSAFLLVATITMVVMDDISFVEEAMKRLQSHKGVRATVVLNADGIPIRS